MKLLKYEYKKLYIPYKDIETRGQKIRIIVGISGATGAIFGIRLLEVLQQLGVETHLVMSKWAETTIKLETGYRVLQVKSMAAVVHDPMNQAASIFSGSFRVDGMIIAPCSIGVYPCRFRRGTSRQSS